MGEGVLNMGAHRGLLRVGTHGTLGHRLALRLLAMDAAELADAGEEPLVFRRAIGAVGPDVGSGVVGVDQPLAQPRPVMGCGVSDLRPANDPANDPVAVVSPWRRSMEMWEL